MRKVIPESFNIFFYFLPNILGQKRKGEKKDRGNKSHRKVNITNRADLVAAAY